MATEPRPPRRPAPQPADRQFTKPSFDLSQLSFDPSKLKLPQIAALGFVVGIVFHACVIFAILDDGSGTSGANSGNTSGGTTVESTNEATIDATGVPTRVPTISPTGDRNDCNAIRGTDYRSAAERQWFIQNCSGG